jgi:hypothetical protein
MRFIIQLIRRENEAMTKVCSCRPGERKKPTTKTTKKKKKPRLFLCSSPFSLLYLPLALTCCQRRVYNGAHTFEAESVARRLPTLSDVLLYFFCLFVG